MPNTFPKRKHCRTTLLVQEGSSTNRLIDILPALSSCPSEPQPLSENFMSGPFPPPTSLQYPSAVLLQRQAPLTPNHPAFQPGSDIPSTSVAPTLSSSYWAWNISTSNLSLRISLYTQFLLPCFEHTKGYSFIKLWSPMPGYYYSSGHATIVHINAIPHGTSSNGIPTMHMQYRNQWEEHLAPQVCLCVCCVCVEHIQNPFF